MFYEVKVWNPKGELKKVISSKKLSSKFWKKHTQPLEFSGKSSADDGEYELESGWDNKVSARKKTQVDAEFDTFE